MEVENESFLDEKDVSIDYTEKEDAELLKWRQMSLKRASTLIPSDTDEEETEETPTCIEDDNSKSSVRDNKESDTSDKSSRRISYAGKKQQSLNFDLNMASSYLSIGPKKSVNFVEEDSYSSMTALDQLKLFQRQQGLEVDGLSALPTRPRTTGRVGRARSKSRRSQSIFGQGTPADMRQDI